MIFTAPEVEDFAGVETALTDAFRRAQEAARDEEPIVFVLSNEHLLGQRGAPGAMLANALLSGMRTLAAEGHRANAVAIGRGRRRRRTCSTGSRCWPRAAAWPASSSTSHAKHVGKIQV